MAERDTERDTELFHVLVLSPQQLWLNKVKAKKISSSHLHGCQGPTCCPPGCVSAGSWGRDSNPSTLIPVSQPLKTHPKKCILLPTPQKSSMGSFFMVHILQGISEDSLYIHFFSVCKKLSFCYLCPSSQKCYWNPFGVKICFFTKIKTGTMLTSIFGCFPMHLSRELDRK